MAGSHSNSNRDDRPGDGVPNDFVYDPKREISINDNSEEFEDESSFSGSAHSTSTDDYHTNTTGVNSKDAFADSLAEKLTRDVKVWRSIVTVMLLLTAVLVTVSTYVFLTSEETKAFQDAVRDSVVWYKYSSNKYK
jgi:hypothetical protein